MSHERFLVVVASFTKDISQALLDGALKTFVENDIKENQIEVVWVPGAFEIPVVAAKAARSKQYAAVIALGCVIRGETSHYDYVAGQAAEGILRASLETEVPIIFGVLTTEDEKQAWARTGGAVGHKGCESAEAALTMVKVLRKLDEHKD